MGFQPINFANIAPQGNEFARNFVDTLSKGYKAGQMPYELERKKQAEELASKMSAELLKEQPEKFTSEQALRKAQTEKALRPDAVKLSNVESLIGGLQNIGNKYGTDSPQYAMAQQYVKAHINGKPEAEQLGTFGKAYNDYQRIVQQLGADSPEAKMAKANLERISQGSQGITVMDPKTGLPLVQVGGSSKGQGPKVYQDAQGNFVSPLTTGNVGAQQKQIIGEKQANASLQKAIELYAPYINPRTRTITNMKGWLNDHIPGANFESPSKRAEGITYLKSSADKLLKAMGLPGSDIQLAHVKEIVEPMKGETGKYWAERVQRQLNEYAKSELGQEQTLIEGIRVPGNQNQPASNQKVEATITMNGKDYHRVDGKWVHSFEDTK